MGLTAKEALELSKGSLEHRGLFFKLRIIYLCGLIDQDIREAANSGQTEIIVCKLEDRDYRRYVPYIWEIYKNMGYNLYCMHTWTTAFFINWDPNFDPDPKPNPFSDNNFINFKRQKPILHYEISN